MTRSAVRYGVEDAGSSSGARARKSLRAAMVPTHTSSIIEFDRHPAFACSMHLLSGGMAVVIRAFMQRAGQATFRR